MYVKQIEENKYQLTVSKKVDGKRKRYYRTVTVRNKTELNRAMKKFEFDIMNGKLDKPKSELTLYQVCDKMCEEHLSVGVKPLTVVAYEGALKRIRQYDVSKKTYSDVTNGDIQLLINAMEKKYSGATVNFTYRFIKNALEAYEAIEGFTSPITKVTIKSKANKDVESFGEDDFKKICQSLGKLELPQKVCVELALFCGLRRGEALGLKWGHIKDNCISVSENRERVGGVWITQAPKTKSSIRTVAMIESLKNDLEELHKQYLDQGFISPYILLDPIGQPFTEYDVINSLKELYKFAGVEYKSYHKLRHTYASFLIWLKTDVNITSSMLGHANPTMTLGVYTHDFEDSKKAGLQVANEVEKYIVNLT